MHKSGIPDNEIVRARKGTTRAILANILSVLFLLIFIALTPLRETHFANNQLPYILISVMFLTPCITHLYYGFTVVPNRSPYNFISVIIDGLTSETVDNKVVISRGPVTNIVTLVTMGAALYLMYYGLTR